MTREILIKDMAKKAGKAITRISPSPAQRLTKEGRNNYVTMADKTSEQIIFSMIREYFPYDQVFSEETTSSIDLATVETIEHLWIIDPIDGTVNYQYDRKYSAISIAYAHYGTVRYGIVYDPYRNEEFFAIRGCGSTRNGVNISVSATTDIHDFTLITDNAYDPALIRKHLETVLKLPATPWTLMKGSTALEICEVAAGQADLFLNFAHKPWDIAAGLLILTEAGGVAKNTHGQIVDFRSSEVICGNERLVDRFIDLII